MLFDLYDLCVSCHAAPAYLETSAAGYQIVPQTTLLHLDSLLLDLTELIRKLAATATSTPSSSSASGSAVQSPSPFAVALCRASATRLFPLQFASSHPMYGEVRPVPADVSFGLLMLLTQVLCHPITIFRCPPLPRC